MEGSAVRSASPRRRRVLNAALFRWFDDHGRDLGFRRTRDPYAVLVAEVMLQQTQVSRVEPAWEAFVARLPTVEVLAAATPADVIRAWGGLGYNGRAVRLHRAARAIVLEHGGRVPDSVEALGRLPGVGPYTARAVAATAFDAPTAAVDTNIRRVIGRLDGHSRSATSPTDVQRSADAWIDRGRPAAWTHALMDVGATLCRPRNPRCHECPLQSWCAFAHDGRVREAVATTGVVAPPFEGTRRWLRGRIVARLRTPGDGAWVEIGGSIGSHTPESVASALGELEADGLLERDPSGRARLPRSDRAATPASQR